MDTLPHKRGYAKRLLSLLLMVVLSSPPSWAQYSKIDRHAQRAPVELSDDISALATYLAGAAQNETEIARACFSWVVGYLRYDKAAERSGKRINQSVRDILDRRKGLCVDYARLYKALCEQAGLQCVIVDGYAIPQLQSRKLPPEANHSWNAVYTDGQWRLVDATWAGTEDELAQRFNTSYCFTPPEYFILNHLPLQPMWQLLTCPITPPQFEAVADNIHTRLSKTDSCYAYRDSIQQFLSLPTAEQSLLKMQQAYAYYPTEDNQQQLAHAMLDYAVQLDESVATISLPDSTARFRMVQEEAIQIAERAAKWVQLQDWQQQLVARLHINLAIALYQDADASNAKQLMAALQHAKLGKTWLEQLPENHYYRNYAERQCDRLLEELHYLLDR